MTGDSENRRSGDAKLDDIYGTVGGLRAEVGHMTEAVGGLTAKLTDQHEETIRYRMGNDLRVSDISKKVDVHEEIASHIDKDYLSDLNENLQNMRESRERTEMWRALRQKIFTENVPKLVGIVLLLFIAWTASVVGLPDWAKKIIGVVT